MQFQLARLYVLLIFIFLNIKSKHEGEFQEL